MPDFECTKCGSTWGDGDQLPMMFPNEETGELEHNVGAWGEINGARIHLTLACGPVLEKADAWLAHAERQQPPLETL